MTAPPFEGDLVAWRMASGSYCNLCPLNHKRRVGCAGPLDASIILIGEMPGKDETEFNEHRQPFGEPFVGRSGDMWKRELLAKAGLVTLAPGLKYTKVKSLNAFIMNAAMCQPPKNKAASPVGRKALACCHDSAVNLLKELFKRKPGRGLGPQGGVALELLTGHDKIGLYRGRVEQIDVAELPLYGFAEVAKIALRGLKPWTMTGATIKEEEWKWFERALRKIMGWQRQGLRAAQRRLEKAYEKHRDKHPSNDNGVCQFCASNRRQSEDLLRQRER